MAKLSRTLLKDIVKECLVEILSEGLSQKVMTEAVTPQRQVSIKNKKPQRSPAADLISYGEPEVKVPDTSAINARIAKNSGGNSIMESILRDTAQNTLPTMLAAESRETRGMVERTTRGDAATKAMASADPMDLFENAGNWAAMAFSGNLKD